MLMLSRSSCMTNVPQIVDPESTDLSLLRFQAFRLNFG